MDAPVNIQWTDDVPDSTYFRTYDVEPMVDGKTITALHGYGTSRSWGRPGVTSTIVFESLDYISVHVGFFHKHGGSQFWRHYHITESGIDQVEWKSLNDDIRAAILDAYEENAPHWANRPGKLRKDYISAQPKKNAFEAYKVVGIRDDGTLTSLYSPNITYEIGKTKVQAVKDEHGGGWYVYASPKVIEKYLAGDLVHESRFQNRVALIRCECWGNRISYGSKIAVTYCRPLEVIETFDLQ